MPFSITIKDDPNCAVDAFDLPEVKSFKVNGFEFFILPKKFVTRALLRVNKKPQLGEQTITINLNMQACSEKACFAPAEVSVELPIEPVK